MIGTGLSLTQLAVRQYLGYSPGSLFSSGEQGVWYDPSDMSTLFEDAAGTIPITTIERPVGLILDKSKGLALGPELQKTPYEQRLGAGTLNGFTINENSIIRDGSLVSVSLLLNQTLKLGVSYKVEFDVSEYSGSDATFFRLGNTTGNPFYGFSSNGRKSFVATPILATNFIYFAGITGTAYAYCRISNITVKELPGNHATASSANRPVLSAQYNLLTKTEQFNDAYWIKGASTISSNATATSDPLGGNTADLCSETTQNLTHNIASPNISFVSGVTYTSKMYVKNTTGGRGLFQLAFFSFTAANASVYANFDVVNGTVTASSNATGAITNVGNGWFLCSMTATAGKTYVERFNAVLISSSTAEAFAAYTGDDTKGLYLWGADLRVANESQNLPPYQRVNTSTDYDTAGFPMYLRFNGTNQWMQTANVDFTGTDKMTVWAGVRKLSATVNGLLTELSSVSVNNLYAFDLFAPNDLSTYRFRSIGSGPVSEAKSAASYPEPITNVLSAVGNISGDSAILRINGTQAAISTTDQGTGNYGNYPLYIGARGGSSLWFNGRIYSLIVRGAQSTNEQIYATEKYVHQKTGIAYTPPLVTFLTDEQDNNITTENDDYLSTS